MIFIFMGQALRKRDSGIKQVALSRNSYDNIVSKKVEKFSDAVFAFCTEVIEHGDVYTGLLLAKKEGRK